MEYVIFLKILITNPCCDLTLVKVDNQYQCEELAEKTLGRLMDKTSALEWQCIFVPKVQPND